MEEPQLNKINNKRKVDKLTIFMVAGISLFIGLLIVVLYLSYLDDNKKAFLDKAYDKWNSAHSVYSKKRSDLKMLLNMDFRNDFDKHNISDSQILKSIKETYDNYVVALDQYNAVSATIDQQAKKIEAYCDYCKIEHQEVKIKIDGSKLTYEMDKGFLD